MQLHINAELHIDADAGNARAEQAESNFSLDAGPYAKRSHNVELEAKPSVNKIHLAGAGFPIQNMEPEGVALAHLIFHIRTLFIRVCEWF